MKITKRQGLWYATYKRKDGKIFMGYSPDLTEALEFCFELIEARHDSVK